MFQEPIQEAAKATESALDTAANSVADAAEAASSAAADGAQDAASHLDALFENFGNEDAVTAPVDGASQVVQEGAQTVLGRLHEWVWPLFDWTDRTALGNFIQESFWLFPAIEAFHLVAFAVLGGTILVVDLRLLGLAFRSQPVLAVARAARPWFLGSLAVMLISGVLLYFSEPVKLYYSNAFWIKMAGLFLGILVALTLRRKAIAADPVRLGPLWGRLIAITNLVLWGTVAWGGRWIGFS